MMLRSTKRQRIALSSSYPRPDFPARFESLNDDTLGLILEFVGNKCYNSFGGLNKHCRETYITSGMAKETCLFWYGPLRSIRIRCHYWRDVCKRFFGIDTKKLKEALGKGVIHHNRRDVLDWATRERDELALSGICNVAGEEGKIDLLNEIFNNIKDDEDYERFFRNNAGSHAVRSGKLCVLKWLETQGIRFCKEIYGRKAAERGHIHILEWLRDKGGIRLDEFVFEGAAVGGQIDTLKWFRNHGCPLTESMFDEAVLRGNLDVLQYMHDEGFPWSIHDSSVSEDEILLYPEVKIWLRMNGYYDGIGDDD